MPSPIKTPTPKHAQINTHVRLFDLVRFMRAELHEQDLITDAEYQWLIADAPMNAAESGSPSPRRLEDYDQLRSSLAASQDRVMELEAQFKTMEDSLWVLRQKVLGMSMGDPWDGEELEEGYIRPIPTGFEDEVAKFDKMHSEQIKECNECLEVISGLAMKCRAEWSARALLKSKPAAT